VIEFLAIVRKFAHDVKKVNSRSSIGYFNMFFFFSLYRIKSLNFINDLFILFSDKIRTYYLLILILYENFIINKCIYIFLLVEISAIDELQFDTGKRRYLSEQLLNNL